MTDKELKTLKDNLWHAADILRSGAHIAANKYGQPILGLIFLRYADILFKQHKAEIDAEFEKRAGTRMEKTKKEISIEKCGFYQAAIPRMCRQPIWLAGWRSLRSIRM